MQLKHLKSHIFLCCFIVANLNSADIKVRKPIPIEALQSNNIQAVQDAIDQGYDVNAKYDNQIFYDETPLIASIYFANVNMTQFLISSGADINGSTSQGVTALMKAIIYRELQMVQLLLNKNAQINLQDNQGNNELMYAIEPNLDNEQLIKLLLNAGVKYNQKNNEGKSFETSIYEPACEYYMEKFRKRIVKMFEKFDEQQFINKLIQTTEQGDTKRLIELLQIHPNNIDKPNELGQNVILTAILFERFELIKELFENYLITLKPNLLIGQSENSNFNKPFANSKSNNPIEYAKYLKKTIYPIEKSKFKDIIEYLEKVQLSQKNEVNNVRLKRRRI